MRYLPLSNKEEKQRAEAESRIVHASESSVSDKMKHRQHNADIDMKSASAIRVTGVWQHRETKLSQFVLFCVCLLLLLCYSLFECVFCVFLSVFSIFLLFPVLPSIFDFLEMFLFSPLFIYHVEMLRLHLFLSLPVVVSSIITSSVAVYLVPCTLPVFPLLASFFFLLTKCFFHVPCFALCLFFMC